MIKRIKTDEGDRVRSSYLITDIAQAVEEIVLNSIDAASKSVEIAMRVSCYEFSVADDGFGISPFDMMIVGSRSGTRF